MLVSRYIHQLIAAGRPTAALTVLSRLSQDGYPELQQEVTLQAAAYERALADKQNGTLNREDERLSLNRLNHAILEIAKQFPPELEIEVSALERRRLALWAFLLRYFPFILLAIWAVFAVGCFYLFQRPKTAVEVEIEVYCTQADLQIVNAEDLLIDRPIASLQMGRFTEMRVPARQLKLQTDFDDPEKLFEIGQSGLLVLRPQSGIESDIVLDQIRLQSLRFDSRTHLSLRLPEPAAQLAEETQLEIIAQPGKVKGKLFFQDSLYLEGANLVLENLRPSPWATDMVSAWVYVPAGVMQQINFSSDLPQSQLFVVLRNESGRALKKNNLLIDSLRFLRPDGAGKAKSSVLSGSVRFLDAQGQPYATLPLDTLDYVRPISQLPLQLVSFRLDADGLYLRQTGTLDTLYIGPDLSDLPNVNPSMGQWLQKTRPWWLILPFVILLLFSIGAGLAIRYRSRL